MITRMSFARCLGFAVAVAAMFAACQPVDENVPNLAGFKGERPGSGVSKRSDAGAGGGSCNGGPLASEGVTCDISFATDVLPIFTTGIDACGSAQCHATATDYDPNPLTGDANTVWNTLTSYTGGKSRSGQPLAYVDLCSTDPESSGITCNVDPNEPCGTPMPYLANAPLDEAKREILRQWLACGAPNN